jgi:hypothetical protein
VVIGKWTDDFINSGVGAALLSSAQGYFNSRTKQLEGIKKAGKFILINGPRIGARFIPGVGFAVTAYELYQNREAIASGLQWVYNEISGDGGAEGQAESGLEVDRGVKTPDPSTGSDKDPADKSGELTKAGRAQQKHGSREGSAFDPAKGGPEDKNAQGQKTLDSIVNSPNKTTESNKLGGTDVYEAPNGRGARFDQDGKFRGFLEPPRRP